MTFENNFCIMNIKLHKNMKLAKEHLLKITISIRPTRLSTVGGCK